MGHHGSQQSAAPHTSLQAPRGLSKGKPPWMGVALQPRSTSRSANSLPHQNSDRPNTRKPKDHTMPKSPLDNKTPIRVRRRRSETASHSRTGGNTRYGSG